MRIHTITEIKKICKEQQYRHAALEAGDIRRVSFNAANVTVAKHLDKIATELRNEMLPDGIYSVLLAKSISKMKSPDKLLVRKGSGNEGTAQLPASLNGAGHGHVQIIEREHSALTFESALGYLTTIADLKSEVALLKMQNESLKKERDELKIDLEAEDARAMSEGAGAATEPSNWIKDLASQALPLVDQLLNQRERRLALDEGRATNTGGSTPGKRFVPKAGSEAHAALIRELASKGKEAALNREMDRMEQANKALHDELEEELFGDEGADPGGPEEGGPDD